MLPLNQPKYQIHASGHASKEEIFEMIKKIKPKEVIPVHTEHPEIFEEEIPLFKIVVFSGKIKKKFKFKKKQLLLMKAKHKENCKKCKDTVKAMLEKIYGRIEEGYKFNVGVRPEDYKNTHYHKTLKRIYKTLQKHRGYKEFVKAKTLPNCDFFVPNPGFVLEFDESQHFTKPRQITLENYLKRPRLGFDKEKWVKRCKNLNRKDPDPKYRDEQRAWYDTLRDFLPKIEGLNPTIRLYPSKDFKWCSLNPKRQMDVKRFRSFLEKGIWVHNCSARKNWRIKIREEPNAFLARIIIAKKYWNGYKRYKRHEKIAKKCLEDVCKNWPKGNKVRFLITCGGFLAFKWPWPEEDSPEKVGDNKKPKRKAVKALVERAEECILRILDKDLIDKLRVHTDCLALGVDSIDENDLKKPHIELVCLIDLRKKIGSKSNPLWTGKSFPIEDQEDGLVLINDFQTHFMNLNNERVMVLGCFDLYLLINRGKKTRTWRKCRRKNFQDMAKEKRPTLVLQHPHSTVFVNTWNAAWGATEKLLPTVKRYASAGKYYEDWRKPTECKYDDLEEVLKKTKNCNTIDFIINLRRNL